MHQNRSYQFCTNMLSGALAGKIFLVNGVADMQDLLLEQQWVLSY